MQDNVQSKIDTLQQIHAFLDATKEAIFNLEGDPYLGISLMQAEDVICSMGSRKIITTGLGKAGHAAEKSASSFSSLGMPACHLHPAQASHGDVGIVQPGDVMLAFSNSGKTREVIETIEFSRKLGIGKIIAVTSHPDSPVRELSDIVIDIGVAKEAGYLSLAPTTSVIMMLIVSDMLATFCACRKNITLSDYALRHHGGYTGSVARGDGIIR